MGMDSSIVNDGTLHTREATRGLENDLALRELERSGGVETPAAPQPEPANQPSDQSNISALAFHIDRQGTLVPSVELNRVQRIREIMGDHRYVSVELKTDEGTQMVHLVH